MMAELLTPSLFKTLLKTGPLALLAPDRGESYVLEHSEQSQPTEADELAPARETAIHTASAVPHIKNTGGAMEGIRVISARPSLAREPPPTYTLFRREDKPGLYCAVPQDRAVPTFLRAGHWAFVGRITKAVALPGFQEEQAHQAFASTASICSWRTRLASP